MTFHSLYRLDQRGPLDCPVVGVSVDDWTIDQLREHERQAIEATGAPIDCDLYDRFAARPTGQNGIEEILGIMQPLLSYASGSWGPPGGRGSARRGSRSLARTPR
jgi:glucose-6-phosphate 1-dehydrogenase